MAGGRRRRQQFEQTVAALEARHGAGVLRRASEVVKRVPHIPTGFAALDGVTGCGGIPLGEMTLLSGISAATDGKVTLAYKTLANAQQAYPQQVVALVDLHASADPDYLTRAGVDMERLLLAEPEIATAGFANSRPAVDLLVELAAGRKVRLIVVNSLADIQRDRAVYRHLTAGLARLQQALYTAKAALIWIDDPAAPWLRLANLDRSQAVRQVAALHIQMKWEQWLYSANGHLSGYRARAQVLKSRWTRTGRSATLEIVFNGTIKAGRHW